MLVGPRKSHPSATTKLIQIADERHYSGKRQDERNQAHLKFAGTGVRSFVLKPTGNFKSKTIQCPYHAWTYALDGKLLGAPLMQEGHGFKKEECPLYQAAIHIWEGFVFINLDKNPVAFEVQMEALIGKFADLENE